jgi:hypothetical protein
VPASASAPTPPAPRPPAAAAPRPAHARQPQQPVGKLRDSTPIVPLSIAIAGMAGVVALLLVLVLARAIGS